MPETLLRLAKPQRRSIGFEFGESLGRDIRVIDNSAAKPWTTSLRW